MLFMCRAEVLFVSSLLPHMRDTSAALEKQGGTTCQWYRRKKEAVSASLVFLPWRVLIS